MSGVAIVAIPKENNSAWQVSSEKIPHLTLLYLGDNPKDLDEIKEFTIFSALKVLHPFSLDVSHRGTLGEDKADVVFFRKSQSNVKLLEDFRSYLLENNAIRTAYESIDQFPGWLPHLTLGYPETPAKFPEEPYQREVSWVNFDKIAIWEGNYTGPEVTLQEREYPEGMAMSGLVDDFIEDALQHYGVLGMKWGVRRNRTPTGVTTVTRAGRRVKTSGGTGQDASEDAIRVARSRQIAKKSTTDALSTKELRDLVDRMNLEQNYARLTARPKYFKTGMDFVNTGLKTVNTGEKAYKLATGPMAKAVKFAVEERLKKG